MKADNGLAAKISNTCLNCLKSVQPSPEKICIPHPSLAGYEQCGPFKITEPFYSDCRKYTAELDEWDTWEKCYMNEECSRKCVEAYHNYYGNLCLIAMNVPRNLTCADFGHMHFGGPNSCGQENQIVDDMIHRMSLLCGCQVVYENKTKCLSEASTTGSNCVPPAVNKYIGAIVGVSCAAVLILVASVAAAWYITHRKSRVLVAHAGKLTFMEN
ncbi:hypothetical protein EB796_000493 [Bugula neritina]|uniref:lysozyme n=1 Tax=Bugula neritina TaxID=10212 RepID=A0A7J7KST2_BUGNE|nr:hypothetical protein EB796_000493 [Bugula neritina]